MVLSSQPAAQLGCLAERLAGRLPSWEAGLLAGKAMKNMRLFMYCSSIVIKQTRIVASELIKDDPNLSDQKNKGTKEHLKKSIKSNINWSRVS